MQLRYEIPDTFWSLFRSVNREVYIDALLCINQEYEYSNYFLSREVCLQILSDMNARKKIELMREESETDFDMLETAASRMLNWLVRTGWLKKVEDYVSMTTSIVIPDYAAVFIQAFEKLDSEGPEETEVYIQNVYATLYSFRNDPRVGIGMLRTALVNTRQLNKALQNMLHNMDRFFDRLLDKKNYGDLLKEHLEGYVEEVVRKKYHILKTSDNFYIYKNDIKQCIRDMREDEDWISQVRERAAASGDDGEDVIDLLDLIERGFDDIEHRIANMDKEHSKYVRATVTRLNYLLSGETDTHGLVVRLLNRMSGEDEYRNGEDGNGADRTARAHKEAEMLTGAACRMNLSFLEILSEKSLYKRRKSRGDFIKQMAPEEEIEDLDRDEVLRMNRIQNRYSQEEIRNFIEDHMTGDVMDTAEIRVMTDVDFEKLILAYDYAIRKDSAYEVENSAGDETDSQEPRMIHNGRYCYPDLRFIRRRPR